VRSSLRGNRASSGAARASISAYDHGIAPERELRQQPVRSLGARSGDVWIGAHAVIRNWRVYRESRCGGRRGVVTRDVPECAVAGGVPALALFDRRARR
jgi:hypothetical protein